MGVPSLFTTTLAGFGLKSLSFCLTKENKSDTVFIEALPHEPGDWHSNDELHWKLCNKCNGLVEETKGEHEGDGKCTICGRSNSPFGDIPKQTVYMILGGAAGVAVLAILITIIAVSKKKK